MQTNDLPSATFAHPLALGVKVLIIDDCDEDRFICSRYLRSDSQRTYDIYEAETLTAGLDLWRSVKPDVVLLDLRLPGGDGLKFLEAIQQNGLSSKLPVIILTGQGDERSAVKAMKLGAADYYIKGDLTAKTLLSAIEDILRSSAFLQQLLRSQQQSLIVADIALRVRESLDLQEILNTIVQEIQRFLVADRVIVYRFEPDMNGVIVAEAVTEPWLPSLHTQIVDTCFQDNRGKEYRNDKIFVADDIYHANLTECHLQLLEQFQVKANLVVPIVLPQSSQKSLWGLLIAHQCSASRSWESVEVQLMHQLSVKLAIAIQQAELYQNLQTLNATLERQVEERTQALSASEQKFRGVFDQAFETLAILDLDGTVLDVNESGLRLRELEREDLLHRPVWETPWFDIAPDLAQEFRVALAQVLQGKTIAQQVEMLNDQGGVATLDVSLSPLKDENGQVILLLAEARDITVLKQAQVQLEQANQALEEKVEERTLELQRLADRLSIALKSGHIGCWDFDMDQGVLTWDDRMYEFYGLDKTTYPPDTIDTWINSIHPDDRSHIAHLVEQFLAGEAEYQPEFRIVRPNGDLLHIQAYGMILRDTAGKPQRAIGINLDITDRKETEESLKESQRFIQSIMDASPNMIYLYDIQERQTLYANREIESALGYTAAEVQSMKSTFLDQLLHPEDQDSIASHFQRLSQASDAEIFTSEYRLKNREGHGVGFIVGIWFLSAIRKGK